MTTKTCGTCAHGVRIDLQNLRCYGVPPTPTVVGGHKDPLGRVAMQVEMLRPQLPIKERGCSLWELALFQSQDVDRMLKTPQSSEIGNG